MSRQPLIVIVLLWVAALITPASAAAQQRGVDTISYTSTCVNSTILFASPLLDTFFRPNYIRWHFSDPASGCNDSSGADKPATPSRPPARIPSNWTNTIPVVIRIRKPSALTLGYIIKVLMIIKLAISIAQLF